MRLLLDTHILLWFLNGSARLSPPARQMIANPQHTVFVSTVSMWEIWLKQSLGKLKIPLDFESRMADESFESLPLSAAHAREVARLPWLHRDPFDRMLIAQARISSLKLVTADAVAAAYGDEVLLVD